MKYLKKFNEEFKYKMINEDEDDEEYKPPIKGGNQQDVVHYEIVIKGKKPYLKLSSDDDTYYVKLKNSKQLEWDDERYYDDGAET